MPLKKLVLENFQVHPKLSLDLDPHITCIIGPSDVGKSAVIRALRWLCQNVPDGAEFIRDGTKQAIVTLQADGKTIIHPRHRKQLPTWSGGIQGLREKRTRRDHQIGPSR